MARVATDKELKESEAALREATQRVAAEKARGKTPEEIKIEEAIKRTLKAIL